MIDYYNIKHKYKIGITIPAEKIGKIEFNNKTKEMKNLKKQLKEYLEKNEREGSLVEIYNAFPYAGHNLTNRQKGDRVRSVWRKIERKRNKMITLPPALRQSTIQFDKNNKSLAIMNVDEIPKDYLNTLTTIGQPKVLIFDLETSPLLAYVWRIWQQNVNPVNGQLLSENMMLSWSAKWLYSENVMNDWMSPKEIQQEDDSRVCKSLWKLIDEADVLIAHNAASFDVKIMNGRFLKHGMTPPSHYQVIDTLLHARKRFRLASNKLDYLGEYMGMGRKISTDFDLWARCMKGDKQAMEEMVIYCDQDVKLLEAVYLKMRPWIMPHPNFNVIVDSEGTTNCPTCGSTDHKEQGFYTTYANKYQQHQCNSCHSTFRSRKAIKFDKTNLTIATPN